MLQRCLLITKSGLATVRVPKRSDGACNYTMRLAGVLAYLVSSKRVTREEIGPVAAEWVERWERNHGDKNVW